MVDAVLSAVGTFDGYPVLPVTRLGPLNRTKGVASHADMMAVFQNAGLLIGIMLENKAFENDVRAFFENEACHASDHGFATMLCPDHDGVLFRSLFTHDLDPAFGGVSAVWEFRH